MISPSCAGPQGGRSQAYIGLLYGCESIAIVGQEGDKREMLKGFSWTMAEGFPTKEDEARLSQAMSGFWVSSWGSGEAGKAHPAVCVCVCCLVCCPTNQRWV